MSTRGMARSRDRLSAVRIRRTGRPLVVSVGMVARYKTDNGIWIEGRIAALHPDGMCDFISGLMIWRLPVRSLSL